MTEINLRIQAAPAMPPVPPGERVEVQDVGTNIKIAKKDSTYDPDTRSFVETTTRAVNRRELAEDVSNLERLGNGFSRVFVRHQAIEQFEQYQAAVAAGKPAVMGPDLKALLDAVKAADKAGSSLLLNYWFPEGGNFEDLAKGSKSPMEGFAKLAAWLKRDHPSVEKLTIANEPNNNDFSNEVEDWVRAQREKPAAAEAKANYERWQNDPGFGKGKGQLSPEGERAKEAYLAWRAAKLDDAPPKLREDAVKESLRIYKTLYADLDQQLREEGVRKDFDLIGGDLVGRAKANGHTEANLEKWLEFVANDMPMLDGYSAHMYWEHGSESGMVENDRRLELFAKHLGEPPKKPLYVTESGAKVHGDRADDVGKDGWAPTQDVRAGLENAWFAINAMNKGVSGVAAWSGLRAEGQIGGVEDDMSRDGRLSPVYKAIKFVNDNIGRGWVAAGSNVREDQLVSRFTGPSGDSATFVANRGKEMQFDVLEGLKPNTEYYVHTWNDDGSGGKGFRKVKTDAEGNLTISVPPDGMVVVRARAGEAKDA